MISSSFWKFSLLAFCLVVCSVSARQKPAVMIYGPGTRTCGAWTEENTYRDVYLFWVEGFISGSGFVLSTDNGIGLATTEPAAMKGWITKYCAEHPLNDLSVAAVSLLTELKSRAK